MTSTPGGCARLTGRGVAPLARFAHQCYTTASKKTASDGLAGGESEPWTGCAFIFNCIPHWLICQREHITHPVNQTGCFAYIEVEVNHPIAKG